MNNKNDDIFSLYNVEKPKEEIIDSNKSLEEPVIVSTKIVEQTVNNSNTDNNSNTGSSINSADVNINNSFDDKMKSGSRLPKENFKAGSKMLPKICCIIIIIGCGIYLFSYFLGVLGLGVGVFKSSGIQEIIDANKDENVQKEDSEDVKNFFSFMENYFESTEELKIYEAVYNYNADNFFVLGDANKYDDFLLQCTYENGKLKVTVLNNKKYSQMFFINTVYAISKYNGNNDVTALHDLLNSTTYYGNFHNINYIPAESSNEYQKYYLDITDDYKILVS